MIRYYIYGNPDSRGGESFDIFFNTKEQMIEWLQAYDWCVNDHLEIEVVEE